MSRRALVVALLVLVLLVAAVVIARGPLSLALVRRVAERNMATDPIAELDDGLHVVLCGAGGPLPDPVRSGPCVAVIAGDRLFVVDAGSGAARNLARMGLPPARVEAVFLTHFHSDHIDGLGELALLHWTGGAHTTPLPLYGPTGVEDVAQGLRRAYRQDAAYRTAHHGEEVAPPSGFGLVARPFTPPIEGTSLDVWRDDDLRVLALLVDHTPVVPAVGYRFDYGGRSLLISGDTKRSGNVLFFAKGVDLLVHEALSTRIVEQLGAAAAAAGQDNLVRITRDIPDYHTTPLEAAEIAQAAGARHLLFYHVVPPLPVPGLATVFLEGVAEAYGGGVTLGRDGSMITLPSGSDAVEVTSR